MNSTAPIRSRAAEEGSFQIPIWAIPFIPVLLYVCLFSGLSALGLVGPDEPRYAAIARAMAETHDWVTPRLWGAPWFEKPVLYYWTAGMAMRVFGVGEFAARLPSALAALLAVIAISWTALRSYGVAAAWFSLLILPTTVAMIGFSRAASPDMLFTGLLAAAMAVACELLQKQRPGQLLRIAFGFFLGAAVLAKGPAAVILAGGATLLWAALSRRWRAPFRFLHPIIIAVFCATALPWYVLCALRNPDFLRVFIWQHNFQRYLTPIFEHRQPFWFFGPIFLLGILPWLPLLFSAIADALSHWNFGQGKDSPTLFVACWAFFPLLFFSLSQSKLPGYILPAVPPAALLIVRSCVRQFERKAVGTRLALATIGIVFPILLGIMSAKPALAFGPGIGINAHPIRGIQAALEAGIIGGTLVVAFALYRKWNCAMCAVTCTVVILLFIANHRVLPGVDAYVSVRPAAYSLINTFHPKSDEIAVCRMPRAYQYGLDYYFGSELPEWTSENSKARFLFCNRESLQDPLLSEMPGLAHTVAAGDGRIFFLVLHPMADK